MRFLKISTYYRGFLNDYYRTYSQVINLSYGEQYNHLMKRYFAWSDNYGVLLGKKGIETWEIVANAEYMQKAWAIENEVPINNGLEGILLKQIIKYNPDIIYFQDSITYNGDFIIKLRELIPRLKLCIGNLCAPFGSSQVNYFKAFDYFTVCSQFFKNQLKVFGIESIIIPHAFDHRILPQIDVDNNFTETSFIFLGSIFADEGFHSMRLKILEKLVNENIPFHFYGNLPDTSKTALLKKQASYLAGRFFDNVGLQKITDGITVLRKGRNHNAMPRMLSLPKQIYDVARPPLFGLNMFKALSRASIGFNIHIDCAGDYAANMRMFETTGVGTCLITDNKSNLKDFFIDNQEVVTYSSPAECLDKIKWLLNNPSECKKIAINGQKRTLAHHNFENRVDLFYDYMVQKIR